MLQLLLPHLSPLLLGYTWYNGIPIDYVRGVHVVRQYGTCGWEPRAAVAAAAAEV